MLIIKICQIGSNNCVSKTHRITTRPGKLTSFEMKSAEPTTIKGMLTPINITGFDSNGNIVERSLEEFTIKVDAGNLLYEGLYKSEFQINRFKNLTLHYQAPLSGNKDTSTISILNSSGDIVKSITQTISEATPILKLNGKTIINNPSQQGELIVELTNEEQRYTIDSNNIKQVNENGHYTIDIEIRDPQNKIIKVNNSNILVTSKNKLIHI